MGKISASPLSSGSTIPETRPRPFGFEIIISDESRLARFDNHLERPLSALAGQFVDQGAFRKLLQQRDRIVYEVYEIRRPAVAGELLHGLSVVHPGRVGDEYFMTKGHFHSVRDTAEVYCCLKGQGLLVMESVEGDWAVEELRPGRVVYVTPGWAHRSVNVSDREDLVTFFVYPGHAGHDYSSIESSGFRKLILRRRGGYKIVDNSAWLRARLAG